MLFGGGVWRVRSCEFEGRYSFVESWRVLKKFLRGSGSVCFVLRWGVGDGDIQEAKVMVCPAHTVTSSVPEWARIASPWIR
jgi:hypothetical protein